MLTREAVCVDCTQQFEETNSMFRVLREVLIDHAERGFEDGVKDWGNLRCKEGLLKVSEVMRFHAYSRVLLTPRRDVIVAMTLRTSASRAAGTLDW